MKKALLVAPAIVCLLSLALFANTPGKHSVTLTWTGSTGATSYNVYRSTSSGACSGTPTPYQTGISSTSWTDTTVTLGDTYFYDVTAVGTGGESACSNEVQAVIPQPPAAPTGATATVN